MQSKNEEIVKEINEAKEHLKILLERLLKLDASPQVLSDAVQALDTISRSYGDRPQLCAGYIGHSYASAPQQLSASDVEEILAKTIKEAMVDILNATK